MFLNMAFYYGFQWTIYNIASGELSEVENPASNIRVISNQIQPRIRNLHAKMIKNRPIMEPVPRGWQEEKLFAAAVSRGLMQYFREIHNEDELNSLTALWMLICGDCYRKVGFDTNAGGMSTFAGTVDQVGSLTGQSTDQLEQNGFSQGNKGTDYNQGEVFDEVVPPFEMYVPEYGHDDMDIRELLHVKLVPVEYIKNMWGSKAAKVTKSANLYISNQFQQRLLGLANPEIGSSTGISRTLAEASSELTYVFELWQKPTKKDKRGRLTIVTGPSPDGVLFDSHNPYFDIFNEIGPLRRYGGLPFARFQCITAPGRYWSISPVEPMRPLQAEYNKTITDLVQNRATVGRNKILAPKTANLDPDEISNLHGQFLEYSGMKEPTIFPALALPVQTERETERNRQDMDTTSGSHEVSRATAPAGVKSGIAINYLIEQDDTTLGPIVRNYEFAQRRLMMMKLAIAKKFYSQPRMLHVSNADDPIEVMSFIGTDIETTIEVVPGSAMPQSRAALQAMYLDMYERGVFLQDDGRPDPNKLLDLMKHTMPLEVLAAETNLDKSRAKKENLYLIQGQQIMPRHYENHLVHVQEHNKFRKADRFYLLHPQLQDLFDQHVMIHLDYLAPPVPTPGSEMIKAQMAGGGGQRSKSNGDIARRSPTAAGGGSAMGALNNPPGNSGGTLPGE